jgi:hypothetical protein
MARVVLDDQTVFFLFRKIVAAEYGVRGAQYIEPRFYKDKKLFVAVKNSLWMSELQMSRDFFVEAINKELGTEGVISLKVESAFKG